MNLQQLLEQSAQQRYRQMFPPRPTPIGPPQQPFQVPSAGNHMVPNGQYGGQAQQLAGLLGQVPGGQVPQGYGAQAQQLAGLLGAPQERPIMQQPFTPGRFMPGFRPGIDTPMRGSVGQPRGRFQEF